MKYYVLCTKSFVLIFALFCIWTIIIRRNIFSKTVLHEDWLNIYYRELQSSAKGELQYVFDCISWQKINFTTQKSKEKNEMVSDGDYLSEDSEARKKSFNDIFSKGEWLSESKSGPGSLLENTERMRNILTIVVEKLKIILRKNNIKILDSSCGDMTWMPRFLDGRSDIDYTGFDIVSNNIENHKKNFSNMLWKFEVHDLVTDPISQKFDLIISRHTTMHLKTGDVKKVVNNFISSKSRFLLTTNFNEIQENTELNEASVYRCRPINFYLPPFNFPPPICHSQDVLSNRDWMTLWSMDTIQ